MLYVYQKIIFLNILIPYCNSMFGIAYFYICKILNLEFDINIKNHLISNLIVTRNHEDKNIIYNEINYMRDKMNPNLHIDIY